jgi:hypothetical protein
MEIENPSGLPLRDNLHRVRRLPAGSSDGQSVATLDRDFVLPNRREFLERMGYEQIPEAFAGLIPE